MHVEIIGYTHYGRGEGLPEALIEHAGRACYRSTATGDPGRFLQARVREGHESIIEHASVTFEISGISRACSHQLVRHRIASYSQESQRYVDMSDPEFVVPPSVAANPEAVEAWDRFMEQVTDAYQQLRALGVRKEDARFVLPNATSSGRSQRGCPVRAAQCHIDPHHRDHELSLPPTPVPRALRARGPVGDPLPCPGNVTPGALPGASRI